MQLWDESDPYRYLPHFVDWLNITFYARSGSRSPKQTKMMRKANDIYGPIIAGVLMTGLIFDVLLVIGIYKLLF